MKKSNDHKSFYDVKKNITQNIESAKCFGDTIAERIRSFGSRTMSLKVYDANEMNVEGKIIFSKQNEPDTNVLLIVFIWQHCFYIRHFFEPFHMDSILLQKLLNTHLFDTQWKTLTEINWYEWFIMAIRRFSRTTMLMTEYVPNISIPQKRVNILMPSNSKLSKSTKPKTAQKSVCVVSNKLHRCEKRKKKRIVWKQYHRE